METRKILELYPLPIACGYRRYRNASEIRERHDAGYYLFEVYLKYAASVAIARYLAGEERDHRVNATLKGLAESPVSISPPDINASLAAVRSARAAREKR